MFKFNKVVLLLSTGNGKEQTYGKKSRYCYDCKLH